MYQTISDLSVMTSTGGKFSPEYRNLVSWTGQDGKLSSSAVLQALKRCRSSKDLESGKLIHTALLDSGKHFSIYVANTLISMYASCGEMVNARQVFDTMEERSIVTWTNLVLGYAECGEPEMALRSFSCMQQEGFTPNRIAYLAVLKAYAGLPTKRADKCREIHKQVSDTGFESDGFIASSLVNMYGKLGCMGEARRVFDGMVTRDAASWNAIILGYAEYGDSRSSLELFRLMQDQGVEPNSRTYVSVLKACVNILAKGWEETDASELKSECLVRGREIHRMIKESGHHHNEASNLFVGSGLVDLYSRCGCMQEARDVFERMSCRNMWSWNSIILGYAESGAGDVALQMFTRCQAEGFTPDARTYVGAVKACESIAACGRVDGKEELLLLRPDLDVRILEKGYAVHAQASLHGHESNSFVASSLVEMYSQCGSMYDALWIFNRMYDVSVSSWAAIILGYVQNGEPETGLVFFTRMVAEGFEPDFQCYIGALKACAALASKPDRNRGGKLLYLETGMAVHSQLRYTGCYESNIFVANTLVDMYAKCSSMEDSRRVFDAMENHTLVSWTSLILGYSESGDGNTALQAYSRMQEDGFQPNRITYVAALKACGSVGALETGRCIHSEVSSRELHNDMLVATSLLEFYGRCGSMHEAQEVFESLGARNDLVSWNTVLAAYSRQGDSRGVFRMFERMKGERAVLPDGITFLSVLSACGHSGLVEEGKACFESMWKEYGVRPSMEHYVCMVDMLGRDNRLEEALRMVKGMDFPADERVWRSVLGACKKWNNVSVGRIAYDEMLKLDECDPTAYVLMSNVLKMNKNQFNYVNIYVKSN